MKKNTRPLVCTLAAFLIATPLAACTQTDESVIAPPENSESIVAPIYPETPVAPEVPSEPDTPVVPEQPEVPSEPEPPQILQAKYIFIRSDGLNVRIGAGTDYTSIGKAQKNTLLAYTGKSGNWYETKYKNRTAYVSADSAYTSVTLLDEGQSDVENVIEQGLRMLGVPYVYGAVRLHDGAGNFLKGFTVRQFDCSSLMQYIFYEGAGKLLNTTTRTQVSQGKEVAKKDIQRGDLLFFTNASRKDKKGIERIGHVALYLGENYILHTASDFAKIEQISATRWSYYITARRIL